MGKINKVISWLGIEMYGLVSQSRRAAVSVPSNIFEGKARNSSKEYSRFLRISRGSLEELRYQILLSKDLGYINIEDHNIITEKISNVGRLLNGLLRSLDK